MSRHRGILIRGTQGVRSLLVLPVARAGNPLHPLKQVNEGNVAANFGHGEC